MFRNCTENVHFIFYIMEFIHAYACEKLYFMLENYYQLKNLFQIGKLCSRILKLELLRLNPLR